MNEFLLMVYNFLSVAHTEHMFVYTGLGNKSVSQ